ACHRGWKCISYGSLDTQPGDFRTNERKILDLPDGLAYRPFPCAMQQEDDRSLAGLDRFLNHGTDGDLGIGKNARDIRQHPGAILDTEPQIVCRFNVV